MVGFSDVVRSRVGLEAEDGIVIFIDVWLDHLLDTAPPSADESVLSFLVEMEERARSNISRGAVIEYQGLPLVQLLRP